MRPSLLAAVAIATFARPSHAKDAIDQEQADALNVRMFAKSPGDKAYACFVRRYDADQLARHPKQKVGTMKLLVSAELPEDKKILGYSFRLV
jgi:hypothetical protein